MAEKNLHDFRRLFALLAVFRLDELAYDRHVQRPHQVGHEHERILQHGQRLDRLPLVIIGDVARQLFHALLNLLSRNYLSQWRDFRRIHEMVMPPDPLQPDTRQLALRPPTTPRGSAPLPAPLQRATCREPESPASTQSRPRSRPPARAYVPAVRYAAPAAVL